MFGERKSGWSLPHSAGVSTFICPFCYRLEYRDSYYATYITLKNIVVSVSTLKTLSISLEYLHLIIDYFNKLWSTARIYSSPNGRQKPISRKIVEV